LPSARLEVWKPENIERRMSDDLDEFLRQAKKARERAATAEGEFRGQRLRVAEMWELLARGYRRVRDLPATE